MLEIVNAKYIEGYRISVSFNNGMSGEIDLCNTIMNDKRPIFASIKEMDKFEKFKIAHKTIVWFNDLDIAPEFLFFQAFKNKQDLQNQFREWGYLT